MTKFILYLIGLYQILISPLLKQITGGGCRFSISCSEYTKQSIQSQGIIKGMINGFLRFLHCQPFAKYEVKKYG